MNSHKRFTARAAEPHSVIVRAAAAYAAGSMSRDEANGFEDRVRTEQRFRQIALGRLAIEHLPESLSRRATELASDIQLAFEAQFPTLDQLELRERVWFESPFRTAFPGINVVTMESRRNGLRLVKTPPAEEGDR